jgi:hypothetical protein
MIEILAQIESPTFRAGIVLWDDVVIEAAPIVSFMKKRKLTREQVRRHCARMGHRHRHVDTWRAKLQGRAAPPGQARRRLFAGVRRLRLDRRGFDCRPA